MLILVRSLNPRPIVKKFLPSTNVESYASRGSETSALSMTNDITFEPDLCVDCSKPFKMSIYDIILFHAHFSAKPKPSTHCKDISAVNQRGQFCVKRL